MTKRFLHAGVGLLTAMILVSSQSRLSAEFILNEIVSSNGTTVADEDGNFEDWIEIRNAGTSAADLAGWGLSDSPSSPFEWVFPSPTVITPGGYLLVWASGKDRSVAGAPLHTNFSISSDGETVLLTRPAGTTEDSVALPDVPRNTSYGRKPGQGTAWFYFEQPTPGAANTTPGFVDLTLPPAFSHNAGFYAAGFSLGLTASPGWTVYYTLDGSDPAPARVGSGAKPYRKTLLFSSPLSVANRSADANVFSEIKTTGLMGNYTFLPEWKKPLGKVFKGMVVRAAAYDAATGRMSKILTRTYFVDPNMTTRYGNLPVISLVSDYVNLFDPSTGIYVPGNSAGGDVRMQNYFKEWVKPANIEYFENGGTPGFSGGFEISIQGRSSPAGMQKGLNVIARDELGPDEIRQPLFAGTDFRANQLTEFKRFVLRAWGSARSWPVIFADAYHHRLAASSGLELMAYRPAVVFINGEYWGLHEMRESIKNSWYHQAYTGIDRVDPGYDLITDVTGVDEGDAVHWDTTMDYIDSHNMANDAAYDYVATRIDMQDFAEYIIHCVFAGKRDWPERNESKWRPRTPDGKWRWSQYDMDHGMSDWAAPEFDMLNQVLHGPINDYGPHLLLVELIKNARFKKLFINTYADWLNTRFKTSVALGIFNTMAGELDPYINETNNRWPNFYDWDDGITYGRDIVNRRGGLRLTQLKAGFSLGSSRTVTLRADSTKGLIRCNSIVIDQNTPGANAIPYPWSGTYLQNQPIDLTALPREGYRFAGWKVKVGGTYLPPVGGDPSVYSRVPTITLSLTGTTDVEALFELLSAAESPFPMHVWDFTSTSTSFPPTSTIGGGMMTVTPSSAAARLTADQGFTTPHVSITNPIGTVVKWVLPTTGYRAIKLSYLTRRSSVGAGTQTVSYTLNGSSWSMLTSFTVEDATPQPQTFDFSGISGTEYNPNFAVRVEFSQGAGGVGGNIRLDDVVLSGVANVPPSVIAPPPDQELVAGATPHVVDLAEYFVDFSGDAITYGVTSSTAGVTATVTGSEMELSSPIAGEAIVTVTAESAGYAPLEETFHVLVYPAAHAVGSGEFRFEEWSSNEPAGSYPAHMVFLQSEIDDPPLVAPLSRAYAIPAVDAYQPADVGLPYAATSRTRINGLGTQGISFINTGRGRDVGAALLALDTTGRSDIELSWSAGTVTPNARVYALSLQYRLGSAGVWTDFPAGEYVRNLVGGHEQAFGPVSLPLELENQPYVQLQWRYHYLSGISGSRAEIRLDNVVVSSGISSGPSYEKWVTQMFTDESEASNPEVSGPMVQYAHDGTPNLLKYALGIAPAAPVTDDRMRLGIKVDGRLFARFYLDRSLGDIVYRLQASPDLVDWSEVVFDSKLSPGPNTDGEMHEVILPHDSSTMKFIRLSVARE